MSAPVDVRAVLAAAFRDAKDWRGREGWSAEDMAREGAAEAEALAAVAELVEAAKEAADACDLFAAENNTAADALTAIRAALAKFGGAE